MSIRVVRLRPPHTYLDLWLPPVLVFQCVIFNCNPNRTLIHNTIQQYTDLITIEACFYPQSEGPISPNRICKTNRKCLCNQKVHSVSKDKKENAPSKKASQWAKSIFNSLPPWRPSKPLIFKNKSREILDSGKILS